MFGYILREVTKEVNVIKAMFVGRKEKRRSDMIQSNMKMIGICEKDSNIEMKMRAMISDLKQLEEKAKGKINILQNLDDVHITISKILSIYLFYNTRCLNIKSTQRGHLVYFSRI